MTTKLRILACLVAPLLLMSGPRYAVAADTPPAAPADLAMALPGNSTALADGSWISSRRVDLRFQVSAAAFTLTPEVEVEPASMPFTNQPNFSGSTINSSGTALVPVSGLQNGRTYHWQARVTDSSGASSAWVAFGGGASAMDFGVDLTPPSRPIITSVTNPNPNAWYNTAVVRLHLSSHDTLSGVQGYTYQTERLTPHVIPPGPLTALSEVRVTGLNDGVWFVAARSRDRAGNWSPTATYRIQLDRSPPQLTWLTASRFQFNPYRGATTVRFRLNKDVRVQVQLFRVGTRTAVATYSFAALRAGQVASITWTGKDARGHMLPGGYYFFYVLATDRAQNVARWNVGGITLNPQAPVRAVTGQPLFPNGGKVIIVSLSRQSLYAYDGDHLVMQTLVTTGNPSLPTPPGSYTILAKYHPFEFVSPWPPGSPYWYAPSWVQYAMLFRQGGYFLHDAPWRSAFGPGTNGPGQPGTNYGGTHGCVNIPPGPTYFLWNWAPIGTPVDVVP